jgi:uncharacterized protein
MDDVASGLFDFFELEKVSLLRFEQQLVEATETMRALVEAGVQRVPELFRAIKRSVDAKRKVGRFLLTGSAQALMLPKLSESLAGRMEVLTLWPFSQGEITGRREGFVDACFARKFKPGEFRNTGWPLLTERMVTGGYPEVLTRTEATRRQAWFGSYITTILERDVRDLANVAGLRDLSRACYGWPPRERWVC